MPNVLLNVAPDRPSIRSGESVNLVVDYESVQVGKIEFRCSAPFKIGTSKAPLAPSGSGHTTVPMKIERVDPHGPATCDILCTFFNSPSIHVFVEITS
jgi:hypothetical protein